jgi:hypothetical protein
MTQQQKEQSKPPANTFRATRELCIAEGFWNLCFVAVQSSVLPYIPQMYARVWSPSLTWLGWLTVLIFGGFTVYKAALATRWLWRIKYLTQPVYVEPTHWQDQFPFTRKRLIGRALVAVLGVLVALFGLLGRIFHPLFVGYYFAVPCLIISVITGWKHFKKL